MTREELEEKIGQWSALTWFIFFTLLPLWMLLSLVDLTLENFAKHYDFEGTKNGFEQTGTGIFPQCGPAGR